jgi:transmembrane sensor
MSDGETQKMVDAVADAMRAGMGKISSAQLDQGWDRLEHALTESKCPRVPIVEVRPRWWLRGLALGAAAALLVLGAYRWLPKRTGAPLQYVVEGAVVGPEETIRTSGSSAARMVFSDDSRIEIAPSTKVRVLRRDANGSRVALRDGEIDVKVRHRANTSWRFDAGPFSVNVVGTAFRLAFDERRGRFTLHMSSGMVQARGPSADRVFTLRAGESLELFTDADAKSVAAPQASTPASAPVPAAASAPVPSPAPLATGTAAPSAPEPSVQHTSSPAGRRRLARLDRSEGGVDPDRWARLIGQGEFTSVVREAELRGIDVVLASAPAAELMALSDAARYIRRSDLARQALLALRARFPGSVRASEAAFFLGRLAEQLPSSTSAAVAWYETYLAEVARGPYAGEALGRQIALLARRDPARARKVAQSYVDAFPHGPQAELARSLLRGP